MTKEIWKLDKCKAEEINIDQFFELNSKDDEIINATVFYKIRRELNDQFMLILATKNQRDLTWKFEYQQILYLNRTFSILNKKLLLFTLLVLDD